MKINEFAKEVHANACEKGWWDDERSFGDIIALCHSELSEALEEFRAGRPMVWYDCSAKDPTDDSIVWCGMPGTEECYSIFEDKKCPYRNDKPEGIAVELCDCIIRILDYLGKEGIDVEAVLAEKHAYNKTRPYRHGGKAL